MQSPQTFSRGKTAFSRTSVFNPLAGANTRTTSRPAAAANDHVVTFKQKSPQQNRPSVSLCA